MSRVYYSNKIEEFIEQDTSSIFGEIAKNDLHDSIKNQKDAWFEQIEILKNQLHNFDGGDVIFEYTIPRVGGRIDNVILYKGIVFVLEFKVFASNYANSAAVQARTYALDLSNFHEESFNKYVVPILVATDAVQKNSTFVFYKDSVLDVIYSNGNNLGQIIQDVVVKLKEQDPIDVQTWMNSRYVPTPTIIEAAEELYVNHTVAAIARHDAAENLDTTTSIVKEIIAKSEQNSEKSICFITGVPGAGKTLAGLNIAIENQKANGKDYACFLSGNFPLVEVLTEALAKNDTKNNGTRITEARSNVKSFIQMIHHFRDTSIEEMGKPPADHVVIFDEAQRAWNKEKLAKFMKEKKGNLLKTLQADDINRVLLMSEPEMLIDYMDRHNDWATIVCLVGGGQDINDGEAGIGEWLNAVKESYPHWRDIS